MMLAAAQHGLPMAFRTPSEVKAAVTGNGRAEKLQVQTMVQRILGLARLPRPKDAADALAIAICHAWRGERKNANAAGGGAVRAQHGGASMLPRAEGRSYAGSETVGAGGTIEIRHGAVAPRNSGEGSGRQQLCVLAAWRRCAFNLRAIQ